MSSVTTTVKTQTLYRIYNARCELLHIGISKSALGRLSEHITLQPWAHEIADVKITWHDVTRRQIEQMERDAIHAERPKYNVVHNGKRQRTVPRPVGFRCEVCRRPAAFVQVDMWEQWHSFCKTHDDGCERYFIEAHRIATPEQVKNWTEHLSHKSWFDHASWGDLVRKCGPK